MTIPALALTAILTLSPDHAIPPTPRPPTRQGLNELVRRLTPCLVKARDHLGHKGTGVLIKLTLWRF
jgi:hypothetical protein